MAKENQVPDLTTCTIKEEREVMRSRLPKKGEREKLQRRAEKRTADDQYSA